MTVRQSHGIDLDFNISRDWIDRCNAVNVLRTICVDQKVNNLNNVLVLRFRMLITVAGEL